MLVLFDDFYNAYQDHPALKVMGFVNLTTSGQPKLVQSGNLFTRSSDKKYVLDNLRFRVTHVEIEETDALLTSLHPNLPDSLQTCNVHLPPNEFYLMQDVYELPDTGSWSTGKVIDESELNSPPTIVTHSQVALHSGHLIDDALTNLLRARTSYLRKDYKFVRARNSRFCTRRRVRQILIVVDTKASREIMEKLLATSPDFLIHYHISQEFPENEEAPLKRMIRTIKEKRLNPDVILFESNRQGEVEKTKTIMQSRNACIDNTFTVRRVRCGTIDIGLSGEAAMAVIHTFLEEGAEPVEKRDEFDEPIRVKRETCELNFSQRHLILQFRYVCTLLSISEKEIGAIMGPIQRTAGARVQDLVRNTWLPSILGEERFQRLSDEQRNRAAANYVQQYSDRVERVYNAIRFEHLMKKTLTLCKQALAEEKGADSVELEPLRHESVFRAIRRLREMYGPEISESTTDKELTELYHHDFTRLVTLGQIDAIIEACH
ncbi:MAG: hypothetical protein ACYTGH_09730 [Planctomycetota bacterium]|jgi:hypothetical protein